MFKKSYYCCSICKAEYRTEKEAAECNVKPLEDNFPRDIKPGDIVGFVDTTYDEQGKGFYLGKIFLSGKNYENHVAFAVLSCELRESMNDGSGASSAPIVKKIECAVRLEKSGETEIPILEEGFTFREGFFTDTQKEWEQEEVFQSNEKCNTENNNF